MNEYKYHDLILGFPVSQSDVSPTEKCLLSKQKISVDHIQILMPK